MQMNISAGELTDTSPFKCAGYLVNGSAELNLITLLCFINNADIVKYTILPLCSKQILISSLNS